jgi:hypothetical protein
VIVGNPHDCVGVGREARGLASWGPRWDDSIAPCCSYIAVIVFGWSGHWSHP